VNPPAKNRPIRAIVLFSGAGGSSWGAHKAGIEIVAAIDLWALAGETHKANFPQTEFIHGRLEDVDLAALVKRLGKIDLIIASPECTSHSPAKGNKPRCEQSKDTAFEVVRFAKAFKCRWLVIENVVGMRRWSRYAEFKKALDLAPGSNREKLNYALALIHAGKAEQGIPILKDVQKRDPKLPHTWFNLGIYYRKNGEAEQAGLGLTNMQHRARLLNGGCTVEHTPGKGTTVSLTIPL